MYERSCFMHSSPRAEMRRMVFIGRFSWTGSAESVQKNMPPLGK